MSEEKSAGWKMLKYFLKNKNAQIGITITWFVAFLVIFFILILFVGTVATIATTKGVGKNEIVSIENGFKKIEDQRELISFLNRKVIVDGKNESVRDLVASKKNNEVEIELKKFIEGIEPKIDCYFFRSGDFEINGLFGLGGRSRSRNFVDSFLKDNGVESSVFSDGKKIKIEFYSGECSNYEK